jgi:hypothetical protein
MNNDTRMEVRLSKKDAVGRTQCRRTLFTEPSDGYGSPLALMVVVALLLTRQTFITLTRRVDRKFGWLRGAPKFFEQNKFSCGGLVGATLSIRKAA